jgi:hypothetical protein
MPKYVVNALHKFQQATPYCPEHSPHEWTIPAYGQEQQYVKPDDNSPLLDKADIRQIQQIVGTFLFHSRALDSTARVAFGSIPSEQSKATKNTAKKVTRLLNYFTTHPDAKICFHKSDMEMHSNAAYLVETKAQHRREER